MASAARGAVGGPGDALVELHDDVGAQQVGLDLDRRAPARARGVDPSRWLWKVDRLLVDAGDLRQAT